MKIKVTPLAIVAVCVLLKFVSNAAAEDIGWMSDCSSTKDWYDDKSNQSFHTKVDQFEPSVLRVTQDGSENWGKAAYVVQDVDLDKTLVLQAKVSKVDLNSAFKVCVASLDCSEF